VESACLADAELCGHVERGDLRAAGTWLVRQHVHEVMSLCRAMVRNLEAAEDLTQEVFSRAFVALRSFRGEASSRSWLLIIARNCCIDYMRRSAREPSQVSHLTQLELDQCPDRSALPSDLVARRHQVKAALNTLGRIDRALVVLRFQHGFEHDELAAAFCLRPGTVRMRLSRAMARMRAFLERPSEELQPVPLRRPGERVSATAVTKVRRAPPRPARPVRPQPAPPPEAAKALGQVLELFDPGVPIGLVDELASRLSRL
jgi:RNA polymerase sigma-70 factor, ECF subfamily